MQDRYAGDIGDFGKFGMLRALAAKGLSIGVNWYFVQPLRQELATNDGGKFIPSTLAKCDPTLAKILLDISQSPERSVHLLEAENLIPGARYHTEPVPVENRTEWHSRALSALDGMDLVFLDPDNGLLVKSVDKRSAKSPKYTFYKEVASYVARGQSVIVYNHRSRKKPGIYFAEIYAKLADAIPQADCIFAITFPKGSVRDYFVVTACPEHTMLVRDALTEFYDSTWGQLGMCTPPSPPHQPTRKSDTPHKRGVATMATSSTAAPSPQQIGFWRETEHFGCFSNWYPAGFDFRGTHFSTSEHWMMWEKARLMGDNGTAAQILAAPTPRKAKELGGQVSPYDGKLWDAVREQLVYYGVREKFLQNAHEREQLLSTGSALLAEASPNDQVWGVGMTVDDPRFLNPAKWDGENLLGRTCMRVRADIRQLVALGCLDEVRDGGPQLSDAIAHMTLLQLSRIPAARAAVYCYATIVSHTAPNVYPTAGVFLKKNHNVTVKDIMGLMDHKQGAGLPVTGWYELVRELSIQQALGRL